MSEYQYYEFQAVDRPAVLIKEGVNSNAERWSGI